MLAILHFSWRNLWRNPRRTLITTSALALGVIAIIAMRSYRESVFQQIQANITRELVGHIQIHKLGYQRSPEIAAVVSDPRAIEATVAGALPGVTSERRVVGGGLAGAADASSGVLISGVVPGVRPLDVKRGVGLSAKADREAVIGIDLAEQLKVDVGGELVLVGQAADGSVANDRYRVVGVADAGTFELNATAVFLHIEDAQSFFGLGDGVHQLVLRLPQDDVDVAAQVSALRNALDLTTLEALSWNEILPELTGTIESKRQGQNAMDFLVFIIVALGVLNATTMATFERTRELGVMLALGTQPRRVVALVVVENVLLGALALAIGVAFVAGLFAAVGDMSMPGLSNTDFAGVRMPSTVHLRIVGGSVTAAAVTAFSTVIVGALLPALRAARLRPIEAMGTF